jgi:hypothetical protein
MKRAITAAILAPAIGATNRDIENWIKRLKLSTRYHTPEQGKPRLLFRDNCLELGFIAGLVRGGALPSRAVLFAASFLRAWKPPALPSGRRQWFVFPAGDLSGGKWTDTPNVESLKKEFKVTALSFVDVGEIVRRVDALLVD